VSFERRPGRIAGLLLVAVAVGLGGAATAAGATPPLPHLVPGAGDGLHGGYLDRSSTLRISIRRAAIERGWINWRSCINGKPLFSVLMTVTVRNEGKQARRVMPEGSFFLSNRGTWLVGLAVPPAVTSLRPGQTRQWQIAFGPLVTMPTSLTAGWRHSLPASGPIVPTPEQPIPLRPSASIAAFTVVGSGRDRCS